MKVNDEYRHFVAIVSGDEPEECMKPFGSSEMLDQPYVVYRFNDRKKLRERYIEFYKALVKSGTIEGEELEEAKETLEGIEKDSDIDFFYRVTEGLEYDLFTGDAITRANPNGRWSSFELGKRFSVPFILKNGETSFQARKKDIDWGLIHLNGQEIYEAAWDIVMDGKKPEGPQEEEIYENMKNRQGYFSKFGNKENYVVSSTAFWGLAYVSENGWIELEDDMDQFEWMRGFYDRFIKPLPDDTLLTIYECVRQ